MTRTAQFVLVGLFALLGTAALVEAPPAAEATANAIQPALDGAQIFADSCASCHQAYGQGVAGTFPPLAANPAATDAAYVEQVIREGLSGPIEVLGVAYDNAMPAVNLTDAEVAAVVAYVTTLAEAPPDVSGPTGTVGPPTRPRALPCLSGRPHSTTVDRPAPHVTSPGQ